MKVINYKTGITFFGIILLTLSSIVFHDMYEHAERTTGPCLSLCSLFEGKSANIVSIFCLIVHNYIFDRMHIVSLAVSTGATSRTAVECISLWLTWKITEKESII